MPVEFNIALCVVICAVLLLQIGIWASVDAIYKYLKENDNEANREDKSADEKSFKLFD